MATRTAPTVDGNPQYWNVSYHFIDASGDVRSISVKAPEGVTNAQINALGSSLQTYSNASLYKIEKSEVYSGDESRSNADAEVYPSVYDNVVILYKTVDGRSQNIFIPAPTTTIQPSGQDTPDVTVVATFNLTALNVLNGDPSVGYTPRSTRFTERREKNQSVKI